MAVEAQQFPVAAVAGIVVVVVIPVMNGEFAYLFPAEFTSAATANVRKQFERLLSVAPLTLQLISAGLGNDAVCPVVVRIGFLQGLSSPGVGFSQKLGWPRPEPVNLGRLVFPVRIKRLLPVHTIETS